jgi:hypothetical protein
MDTDLIRQRAYELWEQDGCPEGRDMEYWLRAERDLAQDDGADLGSPHSGGVESGGARSEPDLASTSAEAPKAPTGRSRAARPNAVNGNGSSSAAATAKPAKAKASAATMAAERGEYVQQKRTRKKAEG